MHFTDSLQLKQYSHFEIKSSLHGQAVKSEGRDLHQLLLAAPNGVNKRVYGVLSNNIRERLQQYES